jgi:hypothetical protein
MPESAILFPKMFPSGVRAASTHQTDPSDQGFDAEPSGDRVSVLHHSKVETLPLTHPF